MPRLPPPQFARKRRDLGTPATALDFPPVHFTGAHQASLLHTLERPKILQA